MVDSTPSPVRAPGTPRPRRRVRAALATLRRVAAQRDRFATAYGAATTAQARFAAATNALRAAAAAGVHQQNPEHVAARLDRITDTVTRLLAELHTEQQAKATQTIRDDRRRITRNERRRADRDQSRGDRSRTHPQPAHPDPTHRAGHAGSAS